MIQSDFDWNENVAINFNNENVMLTLRVYFSYLIKLFLEHIGNFRIPYGMKREMKKVVLERETLSVIENFIKKWSAINFTEICRRFYLGK